MVIALRVALSEIRPEIGAQLLDHSHGIYCDLGPDGKSTIAVERAIAIEI
jgi:hypothetical protein